MEFDNLIGSKYSTPSTKFVGFGPIGKQMGHPGPLIGWQEHNMCKIFGVHDNPSTKVAQG